MARFFAFAWDVLETPRAEAGDEHHDEPYLYVAPWTAPEPGPRWNAVGFTGAEAPWTGEAAALDFFREHRDALCRSSAAS